MHRTAIFYALASAALFGASTPLAKLLVGEVQPLALAGLLYLGSGIGLLAWFLLRKRAERATNLSRADLPWLAGAILTGGVVGPALLMYGLTRTDGATASLLLNLEAVLISAPRAPAPISPSRRSSAPRSHFSCCASRLQARSGSPRRSWRLACGCT